MGFSMWSGRRLAGLVVLVALAFVVAPVWGAPPPTPSFTLVPVDPYASYPPYACLTADPRRRGAEGFAHLVMNAYPATGRGDAWAPCDTHGPGSLHHGGRAWDWVLAEDGAVAGPEAQATAAELLDWLLETQAGEPHARARRLGIVEIIWFERLWTSGARAWAPYQAGACPDPSASNTSCHRDHVHFGFSKAGADGNTSWWQGLLGWLQSTLAELIP
jgi:hypothetical protein